MSDDEFNFGEELIAGLEDAVRWKNGEIALPVINVTPDYGARIRALRKKLGYRSRAAFEKAYAIPAKTLQNWEQGRGAPDQAARAYLRAIEADPDGVRRALEKSDAGGL